MTKNQKEAFEEFTSEFNLNCTFTYNEIMAMHYFCEDEGIDIKTFVDYPQLMKLKKALEYFKIDIVEVKK